jgi:hypothetical protein
VASGVSSATPRDQAPAAIRSGGAAAPVAQTAPVIPSRWTYLDTRDEMRNTSTRTACLDAIAPLHFREPYEGDTTARVCFRQSPQDGLDVIVHVQRGQFDCGMGCTLQVKFDDGPVRPFRAEGEGGGEATSIFVQDKSRFLASMRTAHRVVIEASFYRDGTRQIEFDGAAGLAWAAASRPARN